MRDLTPGELLLLNGKPPRYLGRIRLTKGCDGVCPFCEGNQFYKGPQGGMMTNYYCANEECGAGFNLPPANIPIGGDLIQEPKAQ